MPKVLIIYYTLSNNTKKMAELISKGVRDTGCEAVLKNVADTSIDELRDYEGIVIGSPTYYGAMAYQVKKLIDESVKFHGQLGGKVGGAFSSSANIGGGNETTILSILNALLIHGMVVLGIPRGDHYGPVSIHSPDERSSALCLEYGKQIGMLVKKLYPCDGNIK
ncbi:MAG: flavodoxin family protein [Candidatus Auribacter fodinae]|jgi:NAD(P)H dehydrogenase (quinone)|uniref:Flavodoxin family protein n=1 Tax=Candidatus Auribacter fodinae TaxID=2093366 RepID=A0A3A4RA99_9BACT|nr:MAG: flavodoxin family protein [Candidatus Auribacter fodinae]